MQTDMIREKTRTFLESLSNRARSGPIKDDDPILRNGVLDSMGVIEVVAWMELEFDIDIADDDLVLSNFESVLQIAQLIDRKLSSSATK